MQGTGGAAGDRRRAARTAGLARKDGQGARRRDAALVVLGGILEPAAVTELERVLDAAIRLKVSERLRLPGFVREIEPWLAACDAIVNVSRFEGLSMAVQEALAAGLPVVAYTEDRARVEEIYFALSKEAPAGSKPQ